LEYRIIKALKQEKRSFVVTRVENKRDMHDVIFTIAVPWPRGFLGLANANCEKTREEKGKTSGEFVSDSWFGQGMQKMYMHHKLF
jgi:hypothetical protein